MIKLDEHQINAACDLLNILDKNKFAVLNGQMRTGKTLTIVHTANVLCGQGKIKNVLIITKKGAIGSIENDIKNFADYRVNFNVINYESLHKVTPIWDLVICDEYHTLGFIGKLKLVNKRMAFIKYKYFIGMTGTLFLETFSTAYSLFPICFKHYGSFYKWARIFVNITQKRIGQNIVNDYTKVKDVDALMAIIKPYIVTVTQEQAGFETKVADVIHMVKNENLDKLCREIKRKKMFTFSDGTQIVADNIPKEFQIVKQLQSGCLKVGENEYKTLDCFKFDYMMQLFEGKKICVFHEYIGEKIMLHEQFKLRGYTVTDSSEIFNKGDDKTVFIGQFVSKREGINLSSCNDLIFYSMPYSNLTYLQTRERCILKNKQQEVRCHFICTDFEKKVYDIVKNDKGRFSSETYKKSNIY
jgi:hypothetical protein